MKSTKRKYLSFLSLLGCILPAHSTTTQGPINTSPAIETSQFQLFDVVAALDTFYTAKCKNSQLTSTSDLSINIDRNQGDDATPGHCSGIDRISNNLKDLKFLGFHGTVVKHVRSIENGIKVYSTKKEWWGNSVGPTPITKLKHGNGFYVTDSLSVSRMFSANAYHICRTQIFIPPLLRSNSAKQHVRKYMESQCEPAVCAIYGSKSFWSHVPKVYVNEFYEFLDGRKGSVHYNPEVLRQALEEYAIKKEYPTKPVLFSPIGGQALKDIQAMFSAEHARNLVAICSYDSEGARIVRRYPRRYMGDISVLPIKERIEKEGSLGKLFGEKLTEMLGLSYDKIMHKRNEESIVIDKTLQFDVMGVDK